MLRRLIPLAPWIVTMSAAGLPASALAADYRCLIETQGGNRAMPKGLGFSSAGEAFCAVRENVRALPMPSGTCDPVALRNTALCQVEVPDPLLDRRPEVRAAVRHEPARSYHCPIPAAGRGDEAPLAPFTASTWKDIEMAGTAKYGYRFAAQVDGCMPSSLYGALVSAAGKAPSPSK